MDMVVPFAVYGLSNNLHVALSFGLNVILIPKVDPEKTDELLQKYKPNHIASICPRADQYFVALDVFFEKSYAAAKEYGVSKFVYVPLWQSLGALKNKLYRLKVKEPVYMDDFVMSWNAFLASTSDVGEVVPAKYEKDKCTVIGHTGGTTGTPKGVMLSDYACSVHRLVPRDCL